ncbi:MAG: peptide deformylase [Alphaproteobacteria bacterium]
MSVRPIIVLPAAQLRLVSKPLRLVDDASRALMDDMLETMYDAPGVGLAAIQIGIPLRVVVVDCTTDEEPPAPLCLANPQVIWTSQETNVHEEGCLSIPEYYEEVVRPASCRVEFIDRDGVAKTQEFDGLRATCVQHEIDHLNGILFIDHISRLKRERVMQKFRKAAKEKARGAA